MAVAAVLVASAAQASLGNAQSSVTADALAMQGQVVVIDHSRYTAQEITAPSGLRVREYVDAKGVVFAVSWDGPVMPDLMGLLGSHYSEYTDAVAAQAPVGLHRALNIALPGLVVQSGGHLRAYAGRAYLPQLLPAGVTAAEVQ